MDKRLAKFVRVKFKELTDAGVLIKIHNKKYIKNPNGLSSGCFDASEWTLELAVKKPQVDWILIFLHEYCHFKQAQERCKIWTADEKIASRVNLWEWLDHKAEYSPKQLDTAREAIQMLEWDCEKRVIDLIKKNNLPFDTELYTQGANSYILFYSICIEERKWYKRAPYGFEKIKKLMPKKLISPKDFNNPPENYRKVIKRDFI